MNPKYGPRIATLLALIAIVGAMIWGMLAMEKIENRVRADAFYAVLDHGWSCRDLGKSRDRCRDELAELVPKWVK